MIRPEKYMQLDQCALAVAATILQEVSQTLAASPTQLEDLIASTLGDAALANLQPAINVLYLLGLLDYDPQNDFFIFSGNARKVLRET